MSSMIRTLVVNVDTQNTRRYRNRYKKTLAALRENFQVDEISSIDSIGAKLQNNSPYDVIVCCQEYSQDGSWKKVLTITRKSKSYSDVIVVILDDSNKLKNDTAEEVLKSGAFAYFSWEFNPDVLVGYIRAAYHRIEERAIRSSFSSGVNQATTVPEVAEVLFGKLRQLVKWDSATLVSLNRNIIMDTDLQSNEVSVDGLTRSLVKFTGYSEEKINWKLLRPIRYDKLIGSIIENQKPYICSDILRPELSGWDSTIPQTQNIRSWMAIPLIFGGRAIGLITLDSTQPNRFGYEAINQSAIEQIANQAATAIKHAGLQEAQRGLDKALRAMIGDDSSDPNKIFNTIAEQACELVGGILSYLALPQDDDPRVLEIVAGWSPKYGTNVFDKATRDLGQVKLFYLDHPEKNYQDKIGITGLAYDKRRAFLINDCLKVVGVPPENEDEEIAQKNYRKVNEDTKSDLAVPIFDGDNVVGVINVEHKDPYAFTEEHIRTIKRFAEFAAIAIRNNKSMQRIDDRRTKLESVFESISKVTSKLGADDFYREIAEQGCVQASATWVTVYTIKDGKINKHGFSSGTTEVASPRTGEGTRYEQGLTAWVVRNKEPIQIPDVALDNPESHMDSRGNPIEINQRALDAGAQAILGLPMKLQENVIGVIWFHYKTARKFDDDLIYALEFYCRQAAIELRNAELYDDLDVKKSSEIDRFKKLRDAFLKISTFSNEYSVHNYQLQNQIVTSASTIANVPGAALYENHPEQEILKLVGSTLPDLTFGYELKYDEGLAGYLMKLDKDYEYTENYEGYHKRFHRNIKGAVFGHKLRSNIASNVDDVEGILILNAEENHSFADVKDLLGHFCQFVANHWGVMKRLTKAPGAELRIKPYTVFVNMPYTPDSDEMDAVFGVIREVVGRYGYIADRQKDITAQDPKPKYIPPEIQKNIREAAFIINDLTHDKPNVYFECGYAAALNKDMIIIANQKLANPMFDVKVYDILFFGSDTTDKNLSRLEEELNKQFASKLRLPLQPKTEKDKDD